MIFSEKLNQALRYRMMASATGIDANTWFRQLEADNDVCLIWADNVIFWYLGIDGYLYSADLDSAQPHLQTETNPDIINQIISKAKKDFPELAELLPLKSEN